MVQDPTQGQPPQPGDSVLVDAFQQEVIKQGERLDALANELFKLELAVPGLFATVLTLMDKPKLAPGLIMLAFGLWALALLSTLYGLFPRPYKVMREVPRGDAPHGLSIEGFYQASARFKLRVLLLASTSFFGGIIFAAASVLVSA